MTKRLILTRHTKSSWDDPRTPDHDRPLNDRGKLAAADLGQWLASRGYVPGEVLCSDALRTVQTHAGLQATLPGTPDATLKPTLYNAGPDVMLAVLRHAAADVVMMIGHNPGIAEFATRLAMRPPANAEFQHYPTGATLVLDFALEDWKTVGFGTAVTLDFIIPREIMA
jgi:phosphohistidine phosphatase